MVESSLSSRNVANDEYDPGGEPTDLIEHKNQVLGLCVVVEPEDLLRKLSRHSHQ